MDNVGEHNYEARYAMELNSLSIKNKYIKVIELLSSASINDLVEVQKEINLKDLISFKDSVLKQSDRIIRISINKDYFLPHGNSYISKEDFDENILKLVKKLNIYKEIIKEIKFDINTLYTIELIY